MMRTRLHTRSGLSESLDYTVLQRKPSGRTGYMPHKLRCYDSGQKNRFPAVSIIVEKITLGALKRTAVSYMAL